MNGPELTRGYCFILSPAAFYFVTEADRPKHDKLRKIKSNFSLEDNKTITLLLSARNLAPDGSRSCVSQTGGNTKTSIHKPKVAFSKNDQTFYKSAFLEKQ